MNLLGDNIDATFIFGLRVYLLRAVWVYANHTLIRMNTIRTVSMVKSRAQMSMNIAETTFVLKNVTVAIQPLQKEKNMASWHQWNT